MKISRELLSALALAINVLEGTAGGYTEQEKKDAKQTLLHFFNDHAKDAK